MLTTGICGDCNTLCGGAAARRSTCAGKSIDSIIPIRSETLDEAHICKILLINRASEGLVVLRVRCCYSDVFQHTDTCYHRSPLHLKCVGGCFYEREAFDSYRKYKCCNIIRLSSFFDPNVIPFYKHLRMYFASCYYEKLYS